MRFCIPPTKTTSTTERIPRTNENQQTRPNHCSRQRWSCCKCKFRRTHTQTTRSRQQTDRKTQNQLVLRNIARHVEQIQKRAVPILNIRLRKKRNTFVTFAKSKSKWINNSKTSNTWKLRKTNTNTTNHITTLPTSQLKHTYTKNDHNTPLWSHILFFRYFYIQNHQDNIEAKPLFLTLHSPSTLQSHLACIILCMLVSAR